MAGKYTPTKRSNPCEICGNTSGKCRTSEIDFGGKPATLHLCMEYPDDAGSPNFKYLNQTKDGLWGKYVSVNDCDQKPSSEEERERWRREREIRSQQRLEQEKRKCAQLLSEVERDKEIRKILGQLSLSDAHRAHLKSDRGFTDSQIRAGMYRSVEKFQKLEQEISYRLAGVNISGWSLNNPDSGIICPIFNSIGLIVGWQLRLDGEHEGGRYRWPTSASKKRPHGSTAHLVIFDKLELPIAFWRSLDGVKRADSIGIAEGTGFKPFLTSQRFGQIILGAAGGNFASSPELFKRELDAASKELGGANKVSLYVDAGAVGKDPVMNQYRRTHELLQGWGYTLQVVWWGQIASTAPDSDALEPTEIEAVRYISWEEFAGIASEFLPKNKREKQRQKHQKSFSNWVESGDVLTDTQPDSEPGSEPDSEPDSELYEAYEKQQAEQKLVADAQEKERERQSKKDYEHRVADAQQSLNNLTYPVNISLRTQYLPENLIDQIPDSGIINLKARKGGGKSTLIKRLITLWKSQSRPVISITPRIALGREQAFKWDITWIDECGVVGQSSLTNSMLVEESALGLCWDSFWKIARRDWHKAVIIIDEAELGLSHLATSSTCEDKRAYIFKGFERSIKEVLNTGGLVILSDADLTDIPCNYIKAIAPEATVFTIVNTHKGEPWDIEFYFSKRGDVVSRIESNLLMGVRTAVATDSQAEAEALERKLIQYHPGAKIVRIDSTVTETKFGQEFVKDPNKGILDSKPDILIYTPSMGVGVSIEVEWFHEVVGLFFGALEPSQCRQMLARIRFPIPRIIYCTDARHDNVGCKSFLPEVIKKQMLHFHKETSLNVLDLVHSSASEIAASNNDVDMLQAMKDALDRLWDKEKQEWNSPHIDLYCNIQARRNFGMFQLAVQLYQELIEEGHNLTRYEGKTDAFSQELAFQKIENKRQLAASIANAEPIAIEQARGIKNNPNSTQEDRRKAERAFLVDALPGVELSADFIYKASIENRGRWLSAVRLFWRMQNPDKVKVLDEKTWRSHLSQLMVYLPDIRTYSLQVEVLRELLEPELLTPGIELCNDSQPLKRLMQRALGIRRRLKVAFDLHVHKDSDPIKLWGKLLEKVGIETKFVARRDNVRYYGICEVSLNDADRVAVLAALNRKYRDLEIKRSESVTKSTVEACQIPPVIVNNGVEVASQIEVDTAPETVTGTWEQGATDSLTTPSCDAAKLPLKVEHPIVRYLGKLYRFLRRNGNTALLLNIGGSTPVDWFRKRFGCDAMVQFDDLIWDG